MRLFYGTLNEKKKNNDQNRYRAYSKPLEYTNSKCEQIQKTAC